MSLGSSPSKLINNVSDMSLGFPGSSAGKESTCHAGDPGLIPGSGRSPGDGKGYPLQYSALENSMDSPWDCKESDTTEPLSLSILMLKQCVPISQLHKKISSSKKPFSFIGIIFLI